jgi:rubrerythrin
VTDREALADAREVDWTWLICLACGTTWEGEVFEGERPPCPDCDSEQVARAEA